MTNWLFTPAELHHQFGWLIDCDGLTVKELAEKIDGQIDPRHDWDGYPLVADETGIDFEEIARQIMAFDETYADQKDDLAQEWLALMMEHEGADEPGHANACDARLTEIEGLLHTEFLQGLSVALEWWLQRKVEQAEALAGYRNEEVIDAAA